MKAFTARYYGVCDECPDKIEPGQIVQYNEEGKVIHNSCAVELARYAQPICSKCHMQKPCDCE